VWGFSPAFVRAGALIGVGVDPAAQATQVVDLIRQNKKANSRRRKKLNRPVNIRWRST